MKRSVLSTFVALTVIPAQAKMTREESRALAGCIRSTHSYVLVTAMNDISNARTISGETGRVTDEALLEARRVVLEGLLDNPAGFPAQLQGVCPEGYREAAKDAARQRQLRDEAAATQSAVMWKGIMDRLDAHSTGDKASSD